ncbi:peroxiredoxin [bacterium]|nr:peroxiredoxin [bacterium]|tara:strand:- start:8044 stop:8481 length:438 start_codon:yes stop_codon:yes gene_type:complete
MLESVLNNVIKSVNSIEELAKTSKILLYFYPKDSTPGCTNQALNFNENLEEFQNQDITVIGCSMDSLESHKKFIEKQSLNFTLISDPEKKLINQFQVWGEKKNYGKTYMGLIRSSFLIDTKSQEILKEWRNVRAKNHANKLLKEI